eukprot:CAMPEP_0119335454 /NCGR_PEP_ID=MMETSP1333-20130426/89648_1 /TAXON_ID=418940 /ORGANISM="Scyphosphaera apsteinii, Strain RCC1455" /LENGTH=60 /DNA_ID=CAMNT_0007346005 /DNA_START=296 /DNA_END=475 /DNA_ORIENTATION=-
MPYRKNKGAGRKQFIARLNQERSSGKRPCARESDDSTDEDYDDAQYSKSDEGDDSQPYKW